MNLYPIPYSFIINAVELSWSDINWGYNHSIINSEVPVKHAEKIVLSGKYTDLELELSFINQDESSGINHILSDLCQECEHRDDSQTVEKWLFVVLSWLWDNRIKYEDPLSEVEHIYANFNYPQKMDSFIRYMPPSDGYNPSIHTHDENISHLLENWKKYLEEESIVFK